MMKSLTKLFKAKPSAPLPAVPDGTRYYIIGDIHGRDDLFAALVAAVDEDAAGADGLDVRIVLLGDLVDRGPDSAGVIARARAWQERRQVAILAGNHEEMFLKSFEQVRVLKHFIRHGGRETILSYGVPVELYNEASVEELQGIIHQYVPQADREFLAGFEETIVAGDYLFVHAGIQPGVSLDGQSRDDLLWIREQFIEYDGVHPLFVVHGHTIFENVDVKTNRLGIDTGAFRTGRLTALVLEGTSRRLIQAVEANRTIVVEKKDRLA
ncbi:metallophosphoesterase family protein [Parerythrobacter aurantius]|uniref:metallophosphoesterase family protein n=1 Tax=Parerythrobacter aurantius TaxID=3127706 RepID=UPI00324BA11B